jgi:hypothetical protein
MMPSDFTNPLDPPPLCPFCIERLKRADEHGHVDSEWTIRAAHDLAVQCCSPRDRSLR